MQRTSHNYFPETVQPSVSFLQGPKLEQKILKANTEKTVVKENKNKKTKDPQSGGSNLTTPGSEGILVTDRNGKPTGVNRPQL